MLLCKAHLFLHTTSRNNKAKLKVIIPKSTTDLNIYEFFDQDGEEYGVLQKIYTYI